MKISLRLFLLLFSFVSHGQSEKCLGALGSNPNYPEKPFRTEAFNISIEPGSIEARYPGTLTKLHLIANNMYNLSKDYKATLSNDGSVESSQILQRLIQIVRNFNQLKNFNPDSRFQSVHRHFGIELLRFVSEFDKNKSNPQSSGANEYNFNKINSAIWELMAACLFDGEKIFLGLRVGQLVSLMPSEFKGVRSGTSSDERFAIIREIDIAILNKDGSWRWIEVKNWSLRNSTDPHSREKLFEQSEAHNRIRDLLKLPIRFELVMRYQLPQAEHDLYLEKSSYEKIHYFFR